MKEFIITEKLANEVLNYLAKKPYIEVCNLIIELQKIKPKEEEKE